jgi:hypothetical protein
MNDSLREARTLTQWLAVLLICLLGCQPVADVSEEEHESHEHFPSHWPHTIFKASDRLSELIGNPDPSSSTDGTTSSPQNASSKQITPQQEFIDLIGWLPILAADSDLDRATFDRIDTASTKLQARWQKSQPQDLSTLVSDPDAREIITWLADICHQEQARMQQHFNSP